MTSSSAWRAPGVILFSAAVILALNMGVRQTFGVFMDPVTLALDMSRGNFALSIAVQNLLWGLLTPFFGAPRRPPRDRPGAGRRAP